MSSRKLTRQQQWRIDKVQAERNERALRKDERLSSEHEGMLSEPLQGLVTAHYGRQVEVEAVEGELIGQRRQCHVRANVESLVTGDYVSWRSHKNPAENGVVESRQARRSLLARPDMRGIMKAVAANVDQLLLVVAPEPEAHANLIDRYLVAAEHTGIEPVLVFNKWDLMQQEDALTLEQRELMQSLFTTYQALGFRVLTSSAYQENDLIELQQQLKDKVSVFVGQSGVGKSSIVNHLLPGVDLRVGSLSEDTRKGRHTTTTAKLFHFPLGGQLIDSPGIREFSLGYLEPEQIAQGFPEFRPFLGLCRFRDCQHKEDPGCALKEAVAAGKIAESRFASYHHIANNLVH